MKFEVIVNIDSKFVANTIPNNEGGRVTKYYADVTRLTFNECKSTLSISVNDSIIDVKYDDFDGILYSGEFSYEYEPNSDEVDVYIDDRGYFTCKFKSFIDLLMFMRNMQIDGEDGVLLIDITGDSRLIKVTFKHSCAYPNELESADEYRCYVGHEPHNIGCKNFKYKIKSDWKDLDGVDAIWGVFGGLHMIMYVVNGVKCWIDVDEIENFNPDEDTEIYLSGVFVSEHSVNMPQYVDNLILSE